MTREEYLKWKFCSGKSWCNALRIGVFTAAGVVLVGLVHNAVIFVWSLVRLISGG
jgi:hypothetical protein